MFFRTVYYRKRKTSLVYKRRPKSNSTSLLNPTDPEATFRIKAGKTYQGYVANVEETVVAIKKVMTNLNSLLIEINV